MEEKSTGTELFACWTRIMNRVTRSESIPRDFGTGDLLFPSEIHTLCAIGTLPKINITGLAFQLGITKGAVSKLAKKLAEKGLIEKYRESGNDKEILVRLTPQGRKAYLNHEEYHKKTFALIIREVEEMDRDQTVFLLRFLGMMEEAIDRCIQEKESPAGDYKRRKESPR
jgi:DNA-binding MarR family transcriptional regulator